MSGHIETSLTIRLEGEVELSPEATDRSAWVDIGDDITLQAKDPEELERLAEALTNAASKMRAIRWEARLAAVRGSVDAIASHGVAR